MQAFVREFVKGIAILTMLVVSVVSLLVWTDDRPGQVAWLTRIAAPLGGIGALLLFLWIHFRRDEVPDYLYQNCGGYFDRGGFCFSFSAFASEQGICFLDAFFQNRYERPCIGRIVLRPACGFFGRSEIAAITYEVHCKPAAFGVARIALPVPKSLQGKRQKFEVGASVDYPRGHGRMLRFRDGAVLRSNSNFGNSFATTLVAAAAIAGMIVISRPATVTIELPLGVAEDTPEYAKPEIATLWQLGDPPLKHTPALQTK